MSIKSRIVISFALLALMISALFSLFNFLFMYNVEDNFFEHVIKEEAELIATQLKQNNQLTQPKRPFLKAYRTIEQAPAEFVALYHNQPKRREFAGQNGRHYHVHINQSPKFVVLGEVSQYLVVRPIRNQIFKFLAFCTAIVVLIAIAISYWLARRATQPLSTLTELVKDMSPEHLPVNFSAQFPRNEIGFLAKNIEQSMTRIRHFINREQHFTRDASHELRTPVAIVKNSIELLKSHPLSAQQLTLLSRVEQANWQMEQTINTLLSLAREPETSDPTELLLLLPQVEEVIVSLADKITNKHAALTINVPSKAKLCIDKATFGIILTNLIDNALEHSNANEITISADESSFSVSDTGSGFDMPAEQATQIMAKHIDSKGFGIGLSLVQRLCERWQYDLAILSTEQGATITVSV